jgi:P27 family predicted phage terminase small subunit
MAYPTPKPTAIRELEGNLAKRPMPSHEPKPRAGQISPPTWLAEVEHGLALQMWEQEAPEYKRLGLLTIIDREPFAKFCAYMAEWLRLTREIKAEGEILTLNEGRNVYANPKCGLRQQAFKNADSIGRQFGWTPSARTKIAVDNPHAVSDEGILSFIKSAG